MEFFKIFILNLSLLSAGFIISKLYDYINIIKLDLYYKKIWKNENKYDEINENEKEELLNIINKYN